MAMPERWNRLVDELWKIQNTCTPYEVQVLTWLRKHNPKFVTLGHQRVLLAMQQQRLLLQEFHDITAGFKYVKIARGSTGGWKLKVQGKEVGPRVTRKTAETIALWLEQTITARKEQQRISKKDPF